jgi:hypothetical protein
MNRECLASRSVILCMSDPTAIILLFRYDNRESRLIPSNVCKQKVCTVETTSLCSLGKWVKRLYNMGISSWFSIENSTINVFV